MEMDWNKLSIVVGIHHSINRYSPLWMRFIFLLLIMVNNGEQWIIMINNWNVVIPSIDLPSGYLLHSHGIDGP